MHLRAFIRDIVESLKRFMNNSDYFSFTVERKKVNFYLPIKHDQVSQQIILKNDFYEFWELNQLKKILRKPKIILDIGANIGNHTIYFSKIMDAKVYAFEPQKSIFNILKRNIEINNLKSKTEIFNFGLGDENSKAEVLFFDKHNTGSTTLKKSENGNISIKKLDSIKIKDVEVDSKNENNLHEFFNAIGYSEITRFGRSWLMKPQRRSLL